MHILDLSEDELHHFKQVMLKIGASNSVLV